MVTTAILLYLIVSVTYIEVLLNNYQTTAGDIVFQTYDIFIISMHLCFHVVLISTIDLGNLSIGINHYYPIK